MRCPSRRGVFAPESVVSVLRSIAGSSRAADLALLQSAHVFVVAPGLRRGSTLGLGLVRLRRTKISRNAKSLGWLGLEPRTNALNGQ
jgi:hypothetical protein